MIIIHFLLLQKVPGTNSRICSAHFIGREKSNNFNDVYNTTVFHQQFFNMILQSDRLRLRVEKIVSSVADTTLIEVNIVIQLIKKNNFNN